MSDQIKQRRGGGPAVTKGTIKTAKRLLGYVTSTYKVQFVVVLLCILMSSIASISVSLSLKFLLDDFIIPLIGQDRPGLHGALFSAGCAGIDLPSGSDFHICVQPDDGRDRAGGVKACPR